MARAKLNLNVVVPREGYFNMIDDSLIKPSTRATRLDEFYFKERAQAEILKDVIITRAKDALRDKNSGVYYNEAWDLTMSLDALAQRVVESIKFAEDALKRAKSDRQSAIDKVGGQWTVSMKTARERVDTAIRTGRFGDEISPNSAKDSVRQSIANIQTWVVFNTIADAYTNEIERRAKSELLVNKAIEKGDIKELENLKSKVRVKELSDAIDNAIKNITDKEKSEKEAKAREEEARKKLAEAKTPEEKAQAQAELDALFSRGVSAVKSTFGGKTLLFVGIGLVVLIGGYFVLRKKD
jgi:hypothetical protein